MGTITKKLNAVVDGLESDLKALVDRNAVNNALAEVEKSWHKSDKDSKLSCLFDMLDSCKVAYDKGRDLQYYKELVNAADLPDTQELGLRMLYALFTRYREYLTPEDYLRRLVNKLRSPADKWENDTLRLMILKQFIKYGHCLSYDKTTYYKDGSVTKKRVTLYGGCTYIRNYIKQKYNKSVKDFDEMAELVCDDVFDVLDSATKDGKKPGGKYGLIKMVNDLATGQFRNAGATKKSLYMFAMVYPMTFKDEKHSDTDIEKKLFMEYYTNNLMRFITQSYQTANLNAYELDPSGQGINYKNFTEMIYLYYISKKMDPIEKISKSDRMIESVKSRQNDGGRYVLIPPDTEYHMKRFDRKILSLDEDKFEEYIYQNYECIGTPDATSDLMISTEQDSAFREYSIILSYLDELGVRVENCNYGLWLYDIAILKKEGYSSEKENLWNKIRLLIPTEKSIYYTKETFFEFLDLLFAINKFLGLTVKESLAKDESAEVDAPSKIRINAMSKKSPKEITRTSLIVAYYYYYNAFYDVGKKRWISFAELFDDFCDGIDPILEAAHYQPISKKNVFDIVVALSSFAYLTMG